LKYRIYVDEVGNPDLESSDNPNHRFLSLTGVIIELGYVRQVVQPELEALKSEFFNTHPDDPVILHRKEMFNRKKPFQVLRDAEVRERFDKRLLDLLGSWQFILVTVCIDKKLHCERYQTWRYDPYHYSMAVLLERYAFFLKRNNAVGDVMAESRGGKEDRRLKDSFYRLWTSGTEFINPDLFQEVLTSSQLALKTKANNIAGLQIADLVAHTSRKEILLGAGLITGSLTPFANRVAEIIQLKYDRVEGRVFGRKLLP